MNSFQQTLKYGQEFEDQAFEILRERYPNYLVFSSRFSNNHGASNLGPRAFGFNEEIAVPDFMIMPYNSLPFWVDAKRKKKLFTHQEQSAISIDPRPWHHYQTLTQKTGHSVYILAKIDTLANNVFFFNFEKVDDWVTFNNKYDNYGMDGKTPIYYISSMQRISI